MVAYRASQVVQSGAGLALVWYGLNVTGMLTFMLCFDMAKTKLGAGEFIVSLQMLIYRHVPTYYSHPVGLHPPPSSRLDSHTLNKIRPCIYIRLSVFV